MLPTPRDFDLKPHRRVAHPFAQSAKGWGFPETKQRAVAPFFEPVAQSHGGVIPVLADRHPASPN